MLMVFQIFSFFRRSDFSINFGFFSIFNPFLFFGNVDLASSSPRFHAPKTVQNTPKTPLLHPDSGTGETEQITNTQSTSVKILLREFRTSGGARQLRGYSPLPPRARHGLECTISNQMPHLGTCPISEWTSVAHHL